MLGAGRAAFHANLAEHAGRGETALIARGQVGRPALIVEGVAEQGGTARFRGLVAGIDQLRSLGLGVIGTGEAADGHVDDHIGQVHGLLNITLGTGIKGAVEHPDDGTDIRVGDGSLLQMHGNHSIGMKIVFEDVGGQGVEDAAIDEVVAVGSLHGREDAGDGDGGAHGLGQRAGGKDDRLHSIEVGGHAAEGDGGLVVIQLLPVVGEQVGGEELIDAAVGEQSVAQGGPVLEADGDGGRHLAAVLPVAVAGVYIRSLQGEDGSEGVADSQGAYLPGGLSAGKKRADQGAHAGSGEAVNGDVVLLKPLQDADVGHAEGAAALQSQADDGTVGRDNGRERGRAGGTDRLLAPCGGGEDGDG